MPGSNSRPNVSEGYEVPTELPGSTGGVGACDGGSGPFASYRYLVYFPSLLEKGFENSKKVTESVYPILSVYLKLIKMLLIDYNHYIYR